MGLTDVASILWREREALELLLFKLEEQQLVLAAGRTRWLERATREIEIVLDQIRRTEVLRAAEVDAAAGDLGLPAAPSLLALADAAPPAWDTLLREHRTAFLALTTKIIAVAEANRELLTAGQRLAREEVLAVTGSATEAHRGGRRNLVRLGAPQAEISDEEALDRPKAIMELQLQHWAYQAAMGVTARVTQRSLLDFVR
jgi:hypothetical protein